MGMARRAWVASVVLALLFGGDGRAEIHRKDGKIELLAVGGFCATRPDGRMPAPQTRNGEVDQLNLPPDIVVGGTVVPAGRDVGIGFIARLPDPAPGEEVKVQSWRRGEQDSPSIWTQEIGVGGQIWMGRGPPEQSRLGEGTYEMKVFRGTTLVLSIDFLVVAPHGKEPCLRLTS